MKMILEKGTYYFKERSITYQVKEDLEFKVDNSLYFISGNNGIGKTAFIELLLIPLLKKAQLNFAYLEQNKDNQLYTIQASLALCNKFDKSKDLYINWLEALDYPTLLIADEFDKYQSSFQKILHTTINGLFLVSHLGRKKDYSQFKNIKNITISLGSKGVRMITLENNYNA